jgi:hypothetical protein
MSPRRKASVKDSSEKLGMEFAEAVNSSTSRRAKTSKAAHITTPDATLNLLLEDPMSLTTSDNQIGEEATCRKVEQAKKELGKLECEVISALFPSNGLPESFESIALRLGMTVKEVRDLADNALRDLRGTKGISPRSSSVWN